MRASQLDSFGGVVEDDEAELLVFLILLGGSSIDGGEHGGLGYGFGHGGKWRGEEHGERERVRDGVGWLWSSPSLSVHFFLHKTPCTFVSTRM